MISDPLPADSSGEPGAVEADRDAKVEQLLLTGLDHYFAAQYEQAINVWTRALFFDRAHARARAYIERARSALAERQRESDELLQTGAAAFDRGDTREARRLLQAAVDAGAPLEDAFPLLERLNRLDPQPAPPTVRSRRQARTSPARGFPPDRPRSRARGAMFVVVVAGMVGVVGYFGASLEGDWRSRLAFPTARPAPTVAPAARDVVLAVPRRGELALARARSLAAGGDLRDALTVLDRVRPTDPQKPDADRLRADIQRQLLHLASDSAPGDASADRLP